MAGPFNPPSAVFRTLPYGASRCHEHRAHVLQKKSFGPAGPCWQTVAGTIRGRLIDKVRDSARASHEQIPMGPCRILMNVWSVSVADGRPQATGHPALFFIPPVTVRPRQWCHKGARAVILS